MTGWRSWSGERTAELTQTNERLLREVEERRQAEDTLRRSDERFSKAFQATPLAIVMTTVSEGRIVNANDGFLELLGYSREEVIGRSTLELGIWVDSRDRERMVREALKGGSSLNWELRMRTKSGETRVWLTAFVTIERDGVPCLLGLSRDVTEQREAEEALHESEELFRTLYESSLDGISAADLDGRITKCNQAYADMLGYSRQELQRIRYQDITPSKWHALNADVVREVMERGYAEEFEKEYIKKDGTVFPVSLRVWRIEDKAGRPIGVWTIVRDITERKRAERALRESEERFRQVLDVSSDLVYRLDLESGTFSYVSPSVQPLTGFTPEEVIAMGFRGIRHTIHPEDWPQYRKGINEFTEIASRDGAPRRYEYRWQCKDGQYRWFSESRTLVRDAVGRPVAIVGAIRDVTERRAREDALRESEERFRSLSAAAPIGIMLIDDKDGTVYCNERFLSIFGLPKEEAMGFGWVKNLHPDDREAFLTKGQRPWPKGGSLSGSSALSLLRERRVG